MEHHHLLRHRISSLFFTSCKSKILPDVAENSDILLQPFPNSEKINSPIKTHHPKVSANHSQKLDSKTKKSCSSNSGFFSTASDKEVDELLNRKSANCFSFSSYSSESFRLMIKADKSFSRRFDCKIIDDLGRCPSAISSTQNFNLEPNRKSTTSEKPSQSVLPIKKLSKKTPTLKREVHFKEPLTELYYNGYQKDSRKTKRGRKKCRRKGIFPAVVDSGYNGIKESIAVEKSSNDPYGDFRKSMVEMIVEKQILGAKNLYKLLECFLSLNSPYYHMIILEVFIEICDTLY